jgi:hypothetical protein
MAGLKRTPVRPSGAELVAQIASETTDLPPTKREPEPPRQAAPAAAVTPTATATEQINFRGSPELARILARLAVEQGSIRLVIARLLLDAGHPVPDADLVPPPGRRRL